MQNYAQFIPTPKLNYKQINEELKCHIGKNIQDATKDIKVIAAKYNLHMHMMTANDTEYFVDPTIYKYYLCIYLDNNNIITNLKAGF